jgi:hypothetical protein
VETVEDKIGRWAFATGIPPHAFDHPLWPIAFNSMRTSPQSMIPPKRIKLARDVLNRLHEYDEDEVLKLLNDPSIGHFGFSASMDKATVHHESVGVFSAMLPTKTKPVLLNFSNYGKAISLSGGSDSEDEALSFLKQVRKTRNAGRCLILLTTDTPSAMRAMYVVIVKELPQLFWQPDICHR